MALSRNNLLAASLIAPLFVVVVASFIVPLVVTLWTAIGNPEVRETLPRTSAALAGWNGEGLPSEAAFEAVAAELAQAQEGQAIGQLSRRLNFEQAGLRTLLLKTARAKDEPRGALSRVARGARRALERHVAVATAPAKHQPRSRRCTSCARSISR